MKRISELCNPQTNQYEEERTPVVRYNSAEGNFKPAPGPSSLRSTTSFHYSSPHPHTTLFNVPASDVYSIHGQGIKKQTSTTSSTLRDGPVTKSKKNEDNASATLQRRNSITTVGNQCDKCGRVFNRRADMLKHVRVVHDRVKDFTCDVCGRKFGRKDYLSVSKNIFTITQGIPQTFKITNIQVLWCSRNISVQSMAQNRKICHLNKWNWNPKHENPVKGKTD